MIFYSAMSSPIGLLGIAKSNNGVRRVMFSNHAPFKQYLQTVYPQENIKRDDDRLTDPINQLNEYFNSLRSIFPSLSQPITITFMPAIWALAGLVPCAELGMRQTFLSLSPFSK